MTLTWTDESGKTWRWTKMVQPPPREAGRDASDAPPPPAVREVDLAKEKVTGDTMTSDQIETVVNALKERRLSKKAGGLPFFAQETIENVRVVVEKVADRIEPVRNYPMVGPASKHSISFKCTVYYDVVSRSDWPIPFSHATGEVDVVYYDDDHLMRPSP